MHNKVLRAHRLCSAVIKRIEIEKPTPARVSRNLCLKLLANASVLNFSWRCKLEDLHARRLFRQNFINKRLNKQ
jgi:hypothetical protein